MTRSAVSPTAWVVLAMTWMTGCTVSSGPAPAAPASAPPAVAARVVPPIEAAPAVAQANEPAPAPPLEALPAPAAKGEAEQPVKPESNPDPNKPRKILGKKTADVRDAQQEEAKGAQRVTPRVTGQEPITISASAYVSIIGRTEILRIKHTLDLYYAETGRYPKDTKEFMTEIVHKSGVRLAQLPFYQEYGYDKDTHELVILEYPDRKAAAGR
jgi:hypothetical protein